MGGGVEPLAKLETARTRTSNNPPEACVLEGSDRCALGDPWCITGLSRSAQEAGIKPGPPFKAFPASPHARGAIK